MDDNKDPKLPANGPRIRELRLQHDLSMTRVAKRADCSPSTVQNAENSRNVGKRFLEGFASLFGVPLEEIVRQKGSQAGAGEHEEMDQQFFGFGERGKAMETLLRLANHRFEVARVICFTGHTLDEMLLKLVSSGVQRTEVFMGTKAMARRLESRRQEELLDNWWAPQAADLYPYLSDGRISIRYYDCPPSFTGVALGNSVYLSNHYVWVPTLNWLRDRDQEAYQQHWRDLNIQRRPNVDDYTINGVDMPSILVRRRDDSQVTSPLFLSVSQSFELVWKTLAQDSEKPRAAKNRAIEEMEELQSQMMEQQRKKMDQYRGG